MSYLATTVWADEYTGDVKQYDKVFDSKEDAIHWAKLNDGCVSDMETGELVYTFIDIGEQEEV